MVVLFPGNPIYNYILAHNLHVMSHSYNVLAFSQRNNHIQFINDYYYMNHIYINSFSYTTLTHMKVLSDIWQTKHTHFIWLLCIQFTFFSLFHFHFTIAHKMCLSAHREIRFFFFLGLPHWFEMPCPYHLAASAYSQCASFFF